MNSHEVLVAVMRDAYTSNNTGDLLDILADAILAAGWRPGPTTSGGDYEALAAMIGQDADDSAAAILAAGWQPPEQPPKT